MTTIAQVALFVLRRDNGCLAPYLGGSTLDCWGRNRIEHVKPEPRMSKRAADCPCQTMTLCEGHTEPGARAGRVWCTDKENRRRCREHLDGLGYGPHVEGHAALILEAAGAGDRRR